MSSLCDLINRLITIAIENTLITKRDAIYVRNRIMALYRVTEYTVPSEKCFLNFYETLDALADIAVNNGFIEDTLAEKDIFTSTIMNVFYLLLKELKTISGRPMNIAQHQQLLIFIN